MIINTPLWENIEMRMYFIGGCVYVKILERMQIILNKKADLAKYLEELSIRKYVECVRRSYGK
jgi:hypothetical protein